jgi:DNA-binding MarR family transcriptional regulator
MSREEQPSWTFLSNHTHVLVCLAGDGDLTVRDIAQKVGITERAVMRIVAELEQGGVLERERDGRRNRYRIHSEVPLRHPLEAHCRIGDLLQLVVTKELDPEPAS